MKKKSEADYILRTLVSHLEKKLAKRVEDVEWEGFCFGGAEGKVPPGVASMRSDNAGETMNKKSFQAWARKGGIWLETSNAGQQWQNGKAERVGGLIWKGGGNLSGMQQTCLLSIGHLLVELLIMFGTACRRQGVRTKPHLRFLSN
jgi:hypothetical protein